MAASAFLTLCGRIGAHLSISERRKTVRRRAIGEQRRREVFAQAL
jgi:hypothetical protein